MHLFCGQLQFILILALLQELQVRTQKDIFLRNFENDLLDCPECFNEQRWQCEHFLEAIEEPSELYRLWKAITLLFDRREIYWLEFKENYKHGKCLAKRKIIHQNNKEKLSKDVVDMQWNPGGFQLCSFRFVDYLKKRGYSSSTIWYYMKHSITPLLMQELWLLNFPVPQSYAICGLTHFQAYGGRTLTNYLNAARDLRFEMAQQLLQLALKLTEGFEGYRIYVTDFTTDNFVYDEESHKLLLIDVDTAILVDKLEEGVGGKYKPLPGEGFTYDVNAFCSNQHLDANIYQACLLLRDELLPNVDNDGLQQMLDECVQCDDFKCDMRFQYAYVLINQLDDLIFNRQ